MQKKIIIAIDGLSSSGKSTLAKHLAEALRYRYVDSGAFYRAVTVYFYEKKVNWKNKRELLDALDKIEVQFDYDLSTGQSRTILNSRNIEPEIRSITISNIVSEISTIPEVRKFLVSKLQEYGHEKGLVMDGRDIGTIVFPNAELKIYMTADEKVRSGRRLAEMIRKGVEITESEISQNLSDRDLADSTRITGPLKKADDAIVLDNTKMTEQEQFELVLKLAQEKIERLYH